MNGPIRVQAGACRGREWHLLLLLGYGGAARTLKVVIDVVGGVIDHATKEGGGVHNQGRVGAQALGGEGLAVPQAPSCQRYFYLGSVALREVESLLD